MPVLRIFYVYSPSQDHDQNFSTLRYNKNLQKITHLNDVKTIYFA